MKHEVALYVGDSLGRYGFPDGHPFGPDRQNAFWKEAVNRRLDQRAARLDADQFRQIANANACKLLGIGV